MVSMFLTITCLNFYQRTRRYHQLSRSFNCLVSLQEVGAIFIACIDLSEFTYKDKKTEQNFTATLILVW